MIAEKEKNNMSNKNFKFKTKTILKHIVAYLSFPLWIIFACYNDDFLFWLIENDWI